VSPKNVTTLSRYRSNPHESILIIVGTNISEKVGNQKVLYFPTPPNQTSASALPEETGNPEI